MEKYTVFSGVFSFLIFSFQQSEGTLIEEEEKSTTSLKKVLAEIDKVEPVTESIVPQSDGCKTTGYVWNCCTILEATYINRTALCITMAYHAEEYGVELNVTFGNEMILQEDFSLKNPPPVCFNIPFLKMVAFACFRFYELDEANMTLSGCIDFEGHVEGFNSFESTVGCFKIHWTDKAPSVLY